MSMSIRAAFALLNALLKRRLGTDSPFILHPIIATR